MKRLSRLTALLLTLAMLLSLVSIAHAEEKQSATAWLLYFASNHETDSSKFPWWPQHKSADQPSSETGVEATNAEVTGPGMYTVGLKFNWQKAEGAIQFNLVLDNAESLFPGYYVKITDIRVNGKSIDHKPNLYGTFHDDPNAGFAPIYNNYWDKNFSPDSTGPDGLRAFDSADEATYEIISPDDIVAGDTIEVDFIVAANAGEMPEDIGEKPGKLTSLVAPRRCWRTARKRGCSISPAAGGLPTRSPKATVQAMPAAQRRRLPATGIIPPACPLTAMAGRLL